jgi:hypothetical protein
MGVLSWLKRKKASASQRVLSFPPQTILHWTEETEDLTCDRAYTKQALLHMRKVLSYYSRYNSFLDSEMDFESTYQYMSQIGLIQSCADDIRYLRNLRSASLRKKGTASYSNSDFI